MDREDEVLKKLRALAKEDIPIPDSLQPEKIKERIIAEEEKTENNSKRRRGMKTWFTGTMAALGTVAAAFALIINSGNFNPQSADINKFDSASNLVAAKNTTAKKPKKKAKKVAGIKQFKNYKEMYEHFKKMALNSENRYKAIVETDAGVLEEMAGESQSEGAKSEIPSNTDNGDYSKTNTRTEGVDEADIVKTDGKYIYVFRNSYEKGGFIKIIKVNKGVMEEVSSKIQLEREKDGYSYYYNDFLLEGDTLVVFGEGSKELGGYGRYRYNEKRITEVSFYDISNREKPVLKAKHTQEGSSGNTRMKNGIVYTFSQSYNGYLFYPVVEDDRETENYTNLIPKIDGKKIKIGQVYVPEYSYGDCYTIVTSIDIKNPEKIIDSKMIMDSETELYVSNDNIYFWNTGYGNFGEQTKIMKYSYKDGIIEPVASQNILGRLNNDYSLDEYKGDLRLVITMRNDWFGIIPFDGTGKRRIGETENALYVLDQDLKLKGKIEGLAKGEHIKSARFMGDMAYFVTFRQTDPLFSADLSDPANPKILGYLKIPGFSEYLHPFGKGLLFGLGQDADEEKGGIKGLKLSMFDISNPADVKEIAKLLHGENNYSNSEAEYDRRAIIADANKNLIGFPASYYDVKRKIFINQYIVYGFDKAKGFYERFRIDFPQGSDFYGSSCRGLYIGDYFYIVPANMDKVFSFEIKTGKLLEELVY